MNLLTDLVTQKPTGVEHSLDLCSLDPDAATAVCAHYANESTRFAESPTGEVLALIEPHEIWVTQSPVVR